MKIDLSETKPVYECHMCGSRWNSGDGMMHMCSECGVCDKCGDHNYCEDGVEEE